MAALEVVADRDTKAPADKAVLAAIQEGSYRAGAMVRVSGNVVILSPPLIISSEDVARIAAGLDAGLTDAARTDGARPSIARAG